MVVLNRSGHGVCRWLLFAQKSKFLRSGTSWINSGVTVRGGEDSLFKYVRGGEG